MAVRFRIPRLLYAALAALALAACTIPISYYDGTTYKTLTDLKVDATMLVGSFDSVSVKENAPAPAPGFGCSRRWSTRKGRGRTTRIPPTSWSSC